MSVKSQRDFVLQPRVGDAGRLPWETDLRAFNPNGVARQPHAVFLMESGFYDPEGQKKLAGDAGRYDRNPRNA